MTEGEEVFSIDDIAEPENIADVIYTLMVNPNLSTINYFNDFSEPVTPDALGDSDNDESGILEIDSKGQRVSMTTHAYHHHLVDNPRVATEMLVSRATRKMLCTGAIPVAVSAFLYHINFMDHHGHLIASGAKQGLENASKKFQLKITDRKIRFDHFRGHGPVPPTIIISMMSSVKMRRPDIETLDLKLANVSKKLGL